MVDSDDDTPSGDSQYSYSLSSPVESHTVDSDADDNVVESYFKAESATMKTSATGNSTTSDYSHPSRSRGALVGYERDDPDETIVVDRPPRANQEYYDVLEMASSRLRQDNIEIGRDDSSGDEAVRIRK